MEKVKSIVIIVLSVIIVSGIIVMAYLGISKNNNNIVNNNNEIVNNDNPNEIFKKDGNKLTKVTRYEQSMQIPEDVTIIGKSAFSDNVVLETIIIPSHVKQIEESAFVNCTKLKNVILHNDIKIDKKAFENCNNIESVDVGENNSVDNQIAYSFFDTKWYNNYIESLDVIKPRVLEESMLQYIDTLNSNEYYVTYYDIADLDGVTISSEMSKKINQIPESLKNLYNSYYFAGVHPLADIAPIQEFYKYTATSELKENNTIHSVNNLIDNQMDKSWVEGVKGYGIGEKIIFDYAYVRFWYGDNWEGPDYNYNKTHLKELCEAQAKWKKEYMKDCSVGYDKESKFGMSQIYIANGYCKNEELWKKNARVKTMRVTIDNQKEYIIQLEDTMNPQLFDIKYETKDIDKPLNVVFEILDVYKGTEYEDTAITQLQLLCYPIGITSAL